MAGEGGTGLLSPPAGELRADQAVVAKRPPRPRALLAASLLVALVLVLPLVFLLLQARGAGASRVLSLLIRPLTGELAWNTLRLTVAVTLGCALVGTTAAWLVERTDLPGGRIWAVLLVIPLAIPDFVVSFGWASLTTWMHGFRGAVVVMTLAVYPLVYLPVAASFRNADPGQEEVARSLGAGRLTTFWRITLGQARVAILGGCLLVALVLLAEYGAFEILGYRTFTTTIFTEFRVSFNLATASSLSLVLVLLSVAVLGAEAAARGRGRMSRAGSFARRMPNRQALGPARIPALVGMLALVALALGVPVGSCLYWMLTRTTQTLHGVSVLNATWHTAAYAAAAAGLSTLMALPIALLAARHRGRLHQALERTTYLVLAMPGLVIALTLSYFTERLPGSFLYQSSPLLVAAYAILFFPLALVGVKASLAQAPPNLEEVARSLGQRRLTVLRRVTLPLVGPGLGAAFCLVFLSAMTELTATLILIPTNVQTLATQFWFYQQNLSYGQAAPFALMIIAIAALPSIILGRFFDRLPSRVGVAQ